MVVQDPNRIAKKYNEKDANEAYQLNLYPMANMVIVSPGIECGLFYGHSSAILVSLFAPFIRPTHLPQDDLVK